jgi:hypothetical protein
MPSDADLICRAAYHCMTVAVLTEAEKQAKTDRRA